MPRIIVTGGSGKLGRACVKDLDAHGYDVVNVDINPPREPVGTFVRLDLTEYGQVLEAMMGGLDDRAGRIDGVVHLAAIPAPGLTANSPTYKNNTAASYNVFQACRQVGIRNVVFASSETVLGLPFENPPPYVPVDEEYFPRPETAYSLGKLVDETIASQFCRWDPALKMIGLRFSNVMYPEEYKGFPAFDDDATKRKWNLWGYIDARDGAQAIRKGLESDLKGFHAFIIANQDTVMSRPNAELLAEIFPDVEILRKTGDNETLLSIEKAKKMLGYAPEFSWRDEV
jgi:nucleoside-diphosphate-sugar epimerase